MADKIDNPHVIAKYDMLFYIKTRIYKSFIKTWIAKVGITRFGDQLKKSFFFVPVSDLDLH